MIRRRGRGWRMRGVRKLELTGIGLAATVITMGLLRRSIDANDYDTKYKKKEKARNVLFYGDFYRPQTEIKK